MRVGPSHLLSVVLLTGAFSFQAWATQPNNDAHNAARKALAAQDYMGVIAAYKGHDDLTPIALYRLSIAHAKTGDPTKAHSLLNAAMVDDPSGSFASSPQRLQTHAESVLQACLKIGLAGCNPAVTELADKPESNAGDIPLPPPTPSAQQGTVLDTGNSPATAALLADSPAQETDQTLAPSAAGPLPAPVMAPAEPPQAAPSQQANENDFWPYVYGAVVAALLVLIALSMFARHARNQSSKQRFFIVSQDLHRAIQVQLSVLPEQSVLAQRLKGLVPLLEQEIGREYLAQSGDPSKLTPNDAVLHKMRERFQGKPVLISQASPEEVVALFQCNRW